MNHSVSGRCRVPADIRGKAAIQGGDKQTRGKEKES